MAAYKSSGGAALATTNPADVGTTAPGAAATASKSDHVHAIPTNGVTTTMITNANVTVAKLAATGTPSATTFHRGDDTWAVPAGGTATQDALYYRQIGTASPFERWYTSNMVTVGSSTFAVTTSGQLYAVPYISTRGGTLDRIAINVTTPSGTSTQNCRLGIYAATSATNVYPSALLIDAGTVNLATSGANTLTINQVLAANTLYWLVLLTSVTDATISSTANVAPVLGNPSTLTAAANTYIAVAQAFGALPGTFTAGGVPTASIQTAAVFLRYSA